MTNVIETMFGNIEINKEKTCDICNKNIDIDCDFISKKCSKVLIGDNLYLFNSIETGYLPFCLFRKNYFNRILNFDYYDIDNCYYHDNYLLLCEKCHLLIFDYKSRFLLKRPSLLEMCENKLY